MTAFPTAPAVPDAPPAPETLIGSEPTAPAGGAHRRWRAARLVRGRDDDAAWVRPALLGLLAATGVLYLWNLAASGWGNAFYAAAVQAGSKNWEAFFYGSSDAANSITVDKPPAALWVMSLSVRLFGLSSWSILAPEALMGVATVGFVYLAVRRVAGPGAGLLAGAATALTPVAVLMFRFDNPDALLVLLLTAAGYAVTRATEAASGRWLALAGVLVGLGFLTKMLQALLVLPALALVYLLAAPAPFRRRLLHVLASGLALVATAGWWVLTVELVPTSWRPYIGGSQTNSVWELIWGYNGLGRLTGNETGSVGGGGTGGPQGPGGAGGGGWGATGLGRMFGAEVGGQVAWLLPTALFLLVAGLVAVGRADRTDRRRAGLLLWGGWLIVTALVFSLMAGIFHAYYTVALAPAIGAVAGIGGALLWAHRSQLRARIALAVAVAGTVIWSAVLLGRSSTFLPWLTPLVLVVGIGAALALVAAHRLGRRLVTVVLTAGILAGLGGSAAYAVQTASTTHTGSIPTAGPTVAGANGFGGPGGGRGGFPGGQAGGGFRGGFRGGPPPGAGGFGGGFGGFGGGGFGGAAGQATTGTPGLGGGRGGMGGLLDAASVSSATATALVQNAASYTWVAATVGANNAAGYQLATQLPVMPIGGFNGSDPSPTLEQFRAYVAAGRIHWFIGGEGLWGSRGGSNASSSIASWVASSYRAQTIGGVTMYDLTQPSTGS